MAQDVKNLEGRAASIRRAAVAFANDYGPLPGANRGDDAAVQEVATRLVQALRREGLHIILRSEI